MKVRIGVGTGAASASPGELGEVVDAIEDLGFDSLWLSEVLTAPSVDPMVGLAWAAAHRPKLKLGTTMLLPGRNLVRLAKQLAVLDVLSEGRLLVTFVPGLAQQPESRAIGVEAKRRGAVIDEVLPVLRRLWAGESVSHHGVAGDFDDVAIRPTPVQQPLEFWLGGMARASLERCGRLADGWLPSLCTPSEAAEGKRVIDDAAAAAGRSISAEHFGISLGYAREPLDGAAKARIEQRSRGRVAEDLVPVGMDGLRAHLEDYLEVGFSKFVLRPLVPPASWRAELDELAKTVGDLQT
jgi:probable F420-dependent oxidoreductase